MAKVFNTGQIETILMKVKDYIERGIILLSHQKLGTVHQLIGLNGAVGIIPAVFIATDNFVVGDTITVDGELYTIKMNDDGEPSEDMFVSVSTVVVVLDTTEKNIIFKLGESSKPKTAIIKFIEYNAIGAVSPPDDILNPEYEESFRGPSWSTYNLWATWIDSSGTLISPKNMPAESIVNVPCYLLTINGDYKYSMDVRGNVTLIFQKKVAETSGIPYNAELYCVEGDCEVHFSYY